MLPVGRPSQKLKEKDIKMIDEYLNTDISLDKLSKKYKMPKSTIRYKIEKYRRLTIDKNKESD